MAPPILEPDLPRCSISASPFAPCFLSSVRSINIAARASLTRPHCIPLSPPPEIRRQYVQQTMLCASQFHLYLQTCFPHPCRPRIFPCGTSSHRLAWLPYHPPPPP